jgi:hypothetical protein
MAAPCVPRPPLTPPPSFRLRPLPRPGPSATSTTTSAPTPHVPSPRAACSRASSTCCCCAAPGAAHGARPRGRPAWRRRWRRMGCAHRRWRGRVAACASPPLCRPPARPHAASARPPPPAPSPPRSHGKLHDMEGARALMKAAVAYRRDLLTAAHAKELSALVRDSRCGPRACFLGWARGPAPRPTGAPPFLPSLTSPRQALAPPRRRRLRRMAI